MSVMKHLLWFFVLVYESSCVPPNPMDRLLEELMSAKTMMTNIAAQLEKFNSLYLLKLEQRMNSMSGTLSSLDSNVKNLQERAHVWDTFQLHVAAWNEHITTLDKKVDIISRGQEKMLVLESKLNSVSNIEYKSERIIGKLDDNLATLQTVLKVVENQNHDPLLSEFTTRGVLSTLKTIERKLDKVQAQQTNSQSMLAKQINENKKKSESSDSEQRNKLLIKCNTPPLVEELLTDVASKVDVMFDKFTSTDEQNDDSAADDQRESNNGDVSVETKSDPDLKLIKNLLKRLNQPCKRTIKVLENLENSIKVLDNTTLTILEDNQVMFSDILNQCKSNDKKLQTVSNKTNHVTRKIEEVLNLVNEKSTSPQEAIGSHFLEQREHFTGILRTELNNVLCDKPIIKHQIPPKEFDIPILINNSTEVLETSSEPSIYSEKFNCEELRPDEPSGVYVLGKSEYKNAGNRAYNVRYCEVRPDGIWTVIQRRGINPFSQKFNLSWSEYKLGFGALDKDFWFGNDFIHNLSEEKNLILRVELEDFQGQMAWAEYSTFMVQDENNNYKLLIHGYTGNASDSFSTHNNSSFSTFDRTNDEAPACCPCAPSYGGGWWFYSCFEVNLNGIYYNSPQTNDYFKGLIWEHWLGNYSLRKTKMLVRPRTSIDPEIGSGTEPDIDDSLDIPEDP